MCFKRFFTMEIPFASRNPTSPSRTYVKKTLQNVTNIIENISKKSMQNGAKMGRLGVSWGRLGGIWGSLGASWRQVKREKIAIAT